jgi:chromosome segregation ATPase
MRNTVIAIALLGSLLGVMLMARDPAVPTETPPRASESAQNSVLLSRIAALEDMVSFHTHDRDLQNILERLQALESAQGDGRREKRSADPAVPIPSRTTTGELNRLRQDVQNFSNKLANLDRSLSPLKQEIDKLKHSFVRVESSLARVDLGR